MSLLSVIVSEEKSRIEKMIFCYEQEVAALPKGTLVYKKAGNNAYYYLQFREGKKTVSNYVGIESDKVEELRTQINRRRHIEAMLKGLRSEYAQAIKIGG
jgi:hypothetical protein